MGGAGAQWETKGTVRAASMIAPNRPPITCPCCCRPTQAPPSASTCTASRRSGTSGRRACARRARAAPPPTPPRPTSTRAPRWGWLALSQPVAGRVPAAVSCTSSCRSHASTHVLRVGPITVPQRMVDHLKRERFTAIFDYLRRGDPCPHANLLEAVAVSAGPCLREPDGWRGADWLVLCAPCLSIRLCYRLPHQPHNNRTRRSWTQSTPK